MGMALFSRPSAWLYHEGTCHEVGHTWNPSCLYSFAELFCIVFWEGFKIYLPLYLVNSVITHLLTFSLFRACRWWTCFAAGHRVRY